MATVTSRVVDDYEGTTSTMVWVAPTGDYENDGWIPPLPSYESTTPTDLFAAPTGTSVETKKLLDKDIDKKQPEKIVAIAMGVGLPVACFILFGFLWMWMVRDGVRQKRDAERKKIQAREAKMKKYYTSELDYSLAALDDFKEPPQVFSAPGRPRSILKNRVSPDLHPDDIYTLLPPKPKPRSGWSPKFSYQRYLDEMAKWNRAKEAIEKALEVAKRNAASVARTREKDEEARRRTAEAMKMQDPEMQAEEVEEDIEKGNKCQEKKVCKNRQEAMRKLEQGPDPNKSSPTVGYMDHLDECEKGEWNGDEGFEYERAQEDGDDYIQRHSWETGESSKSAKARGKEKEVQMPASGSRFIEEV